MRHLVVGTAGHIDHGKSRLVRALTGVDPDRLAEEKRRGITIELGFADLRLDDSLTLSFVDVPGHERFVRHMVAGATGIDAVLLVVAADQGIQPQSREHLRICELLGVRTGVVALTKIDLVDADLLEVVTLEVEEWLAGSFLAGASLRPVSATEGTGIDALREALASCAPAVAARRRPSAPRLPVDRSFTLRGFGTVVTGTLVGGELRTGDELEALPGGVRTRVRALEVHREAVEHVVAGRRVAVNLQGVSPDAVPRGATLVRPGTLAATRRVWARVELDDGVPAALRKSGAVRLHHGTDDGPARVALRRAEPDGRFAAEIAFATPRALAAGDRFVLRRPAPLDTIGGGVVVDAHPPPRRLAPDERLPDPSDLAGAVAERLRAAGPAGLEVEALRVSLGVTAEELAATEAEADAVPVGGRRVARAAWDGAGEALADALRALHRDEPLRIAFPLDRVRAAAGLEVPREVLRARIDASVSDGTLERQGDRVRIAGHRVRLDDGQRRRADSVAGALRDDGLEPRDPASFSADEAPIVEWLVEAGTLVRLPDGKLFHRDPIDALVRRLRTEVGGRLDVAGFKALAGVSRKHAIPLLEYLDASGVTRRSGNFREILPP